MRRLLDAGRRAGLEDASLERLEASFRLSLDWRARTLHEEHPDALHPGRVALILLEDAAAGDGELLSAAVLCDRLPPERTPPEASIAATAGPAVIELLRQVPGPMEDELLLEALLALPPRALALALAERLDHARHLHLRPLREWAAVHHQTCAVYAPVADRAQHPLARRYRWWCPMFRRRFLDSVRP